jgi:hypothetical protein
MNTTKPISAVLTVPSYRAHLLRVAKARLGRRPYPSALCGTTPARDSDGWEPSTKLPACPRCAAAAGLSPTTPTPPKKTAAPPPPPTKEPTVVVPRLVVDKTASGYESRVLAAMERTTEKGKALTVAQQVGRDAGGGWIILGTDGFRALLRKGESATKTTHRITSGPSPRVGFDLTPELEVALREAWKAVDRKRPTVWLKVDAAKRRLTIDPAFGPGHWQVKLTGKHLASIRIGVNLRWLLDGFGRGGRLGYEAGPNGGKLPLVLDTTDKLRYVVMPVAMPPERKVAAPKTAPAPAPAAPEPAKAVAP